jgi:hypothetical protein
MICRICKKKLKTKVTLRRHYIRIHDGAHVTKKQRPKTAAERQAKHRALKPMKLRPRRGNKTLAVPFDINDCFDQGKHNTPSSIIDVKSSSLQTTDDCRTVCWSRGFPAHTSPRMNM